MSRPRLGRDDDPRRLSRAEQSSPPDLQLKVVNSFVQARVVQTVAKYITYIVVCTTDIQTVVLYLYISSINYCMHRVLLRPLSFSREDESKNWLPGRSWPAGGALHLHCWMDGQPAGSPGSQERIYSR